MEAHITFLNPPSQKMSVVNLFDLSHNFQQPGGGQEWLMQRYLHTQIAKQQQRQDAQAQQDRDQLTKNISKHLSYMEEKLTEKS